jgi:hypothetical protein
MKGAISGALAAMLLLVVLIFGMMFAYVAWVGIKPAAVTVTYKGEFDKVYAPKYVGGTDLTITETTITKGATIAPANYTTDLNGTDGQTTYAAYGLKITGSNGLEKLDVDIDLATGLSGKLAIRKAYILKDEEGVTMDASNAVYVGTVETDGSSASIRASAVPEGRYVVVVEVKSISTSTIARGALILTQSFDATTEGDVDSFTLNIYNKS